MEVDFLTEVDILTMITPFRSYKTDKKTSMGQNGTLWKIFDRSVQPFYRDAAIYSYIYHTEIATLYIMYYTDNTLKESDFSDDLKIFLFMTGHIYIFAIHFFFFFFSRPRGD